MIRMLVVGYVFAIRSERLICREVQVNLAYRWFCKLGIEDAIPDHSAFSRARNERFRIFGAHSGLKSDIARESDVRPACGPLTRGRPSQPCFTIGHALSLRGRAASSAGTVASSLR
jgi:hypothetical protein